MSDGVQLNPGDGGDIAAADDIAGQKYQRVKIVLGADGFNDGDVSSANRMPITGTVAVSNFPATVDVSGSTVSTGLTQPLTDTQLRATPVPVSGTVAFSNTSIAVTDSGGSLSVDDGGGSLTVDGTVAVSGSVAVTGTFWQTTQPVSGTVAVSNSTFPVTDNSGSLTVDAPASAPVYVQTANTGRTELRFYAVAAAAGTTGTETAITLTKSSGTSATSTGTSFVVTSGKRFKITHFSVATRGNATATVQTTTFSLRINTGGAVTTTSTPIILAARSATPATASAWDRYVVTLPADGMEIPGDGTLQFGITAAATYTTNAPTWDVVIIGYEY